MRSPIVDITMNSESLEMYAEITRVTGSHSDIYELKTKQCEWTLDESFYITLKLVKGEGFPVITIEDACDKFDQINQIIGYATYRGFKVVCNF